MNHTEIKVLLGPTIYNRAFLYAKNGMVLSIDEKPNGIIIALVKGSGGNRYKVIIDPVDEYYGCDCPYPGLCKHIGAVLIEIEEEAMGPPRLSLPPGNRGSFHIASDEPEKIEAMLFETIEKQLETIDENEKRYADPAKGETESRLRKSLHLNSCYKVDKKSKQRYRPILVISEADYYFGLTIRPCAQYIKRDGTPGRIVNFSKAMITEEVDDKTALILEELENFYYHTPRIGDFLPYLINNEDIPLLYHGRGKYYPVRITPFDQVKIDFQPAEVKNDTVNYRAEFSLFYNKNYIAKVYNAGIFKINGFSIITVIKNKEDDSAILLYNFNLPHFTHLLKSLTGRYSRTTFSDIEEIKDYIHKKNIKHITIDFNPRNIVFIKPKPLPVFEIDSDNYPGKTSGRLYFRYGVMECAISDKESYFNMSDPKNSEDDIIIYERNHSLENLYFNHLMMTIKRDFHTEELRTPPPGPGEKSFTGLIIRADNLTFLKRTAPRLLSRGYEMRIKKMGKNLSIQTGAIKTRLTDGLDWFGITPYIERDDGSRGELDDDQDMIHFGMVKSGGAYTFITGDNLDAILKVLDRKRKGGEIQIPKLEFNTLEKLMPLIEEDGRDVLKETFELYEKLKNTEKIKSTLLPKKFNGKLREYQKKGFNWLHFLHDNGLGGCLADDMGLGKTVQTLALLQKLKEAGSLKPSLITAPVTTIANWIYEIERFTPHLTYQRHLGTDRKKEIDHFKKFDITITSYQTLQRDAKIFQEYRWYYIILDESQQIKNPKSKKSKTVKLLKADHRLTLTGTPVENNSVDLYSQMDFINPGLLGSLAEFQRSYSSAIERHKNESKIENLKTLTTPFILRRKKENVLNDLPEKEEMIYYMEMDKKQSKIYEKLREEYIGKVNDSFEKKGVEGSTMVVLEALLRLRQVALFPRLVNESFTHAGSCKFEALTEMLSEILNEDHKVLLFSQFVKVLQIIRGYLDENNILYTYIDGSTKNREDEINRFQNDDSRKVFLLSIKAGGVGINLTAADYVIIFDPWWNPAVENQAIDRSHRIGQTKKVSVYKLIVKNTVEERIMELQERKKELVKNIISDDAGALRGLDRDEILALLR